MRLRLDCGAGPLAIFANHRNHVGDGAVLIGNNSTPALFEFHRMWIVRLVHPGNLGILLQHTSMRNAPILIRY